MEAPTLTRRVPFRRLLPGSASAADEKDVARANRVVGKVVAAL